MSFISSLFSSPEPTRPPPTPSAPPPVPTLSDANIEAADREARARLMARKGAEASVLTKGLGLGDTSTGGGGATLQRQTLLGGSGTV